MQSSRKIFRFVLAAMIAGVTTAVALPAGTLGAASEENCSCNDDGYGQYKCSADQQSCKGGGEICNLTCRD